MWAKFSSSKNLKLIFFFKYIYLFLTFTKLSVTIVFLPFDFESNSSSMSMFQLLIWGSPHPTASALLIQRLLSPATAARQRSFPESSHPSKPAPINRAQGKAGQLQNDRHLYYKPQILCSRGPVCCAAHTPSIPHIIMSKPVGTVSTGAPSVICHLCLAKLAIICFLSFRPLGLYVPLVCC